MKFKAILMALFFVLCNTISLAENSNTVTRSDLISLYGLPDNEYLDGFITEFSPTIEYLECVNIEEVFQNYMLRKYLEINDCNYLLGVTRNNEELTGISEIGKILWFWNTDGAVKVRLFDFDERILYYDDSNFLSDVQTANTRSLKDSELKKIIDSLKQYHVTEWEETYISSINKSTGYLFWCLVIEYKDGTYFVSDGTGSFADNLPPTYSDVKDFLENQ